MSSHALPVPSASPHPIRKGSGSHPAATAISMLLVIFLVLFPKGGVKFGLVPLTWGYLLLGITLPIFIVLRLIVLPLRFRRGTLLAFASTVPFDILFFYSLVQNGVETLGVAISTFVSFCVLPFTFLLVYPAFYESLNGKRIERTMRTSMLSAALFGIVLFVMYPLTGHIFEVPYLTVNAGDYGLIESTKHINRGVFLKLISTYNNGNVYGVSTIILLPMYNYFEKKAWRRNLLKLALILTLSRTVWFALIVDQFLSLARLGYNAALTFPRVVVGATLKRTIFLFTTVGAILVGFAFTSGNLAFLFDQQLGGRSESINNAFTHITLLPTVNVRAFLEVMYASALTDYGVLGLLSIILIFAFPILLFFLNPGVIRSPVRMAALKGLLLYMIAACVDGATNLIPVLAFYWFAYMVFLEGWPGEAPEPAGTAFSTLSQSPVLPDSLTYPELQS